MIGPQVGTMAIQNGEFKLEVGDLELWYKVAGTGPVLVVQAPGWGIGSGLYVQSLKPLERDFTVVYYDPRGSGRSDAPPDPHDIDIGVLVEDLEALRARLKLDSFALMGHSHGGLIALNYALEYPQHVSHLLALDAQLGVEEPAADVRRTLPELAKDARLTEAIETFAGPRSLKSDEDLGAFLVKMAPLYFRVPDGEGVATLRAYVKANRISLAAMVATSSSDGRFLVRDRLGDIRLPSLVMVGRHDFICSPVQAQIIHEGIAGSKLVVFEQSGHLPWVEEPDLFFTTVKNFLTS